MTHNKYLSTKPTKSQPTFCLENRFQQHPRALHVGRSLVHHTTALTPGTARIATLIGPSATGKTTLLREVSAVVASRVPSTDDPTERRHPVLTITSQPDQSIKGLQLAMLAEMGFAVQNTREGTDKLTRRCTAMIHQCGVQVVMIDEAQELTSSLARRGVASVADWLKQLFDATGIPFVLCGIGKLNHLLQVDDQLVSRMARPLYLLPYYCVDQRDQQAYELLINDSLQELSKHYSLSLDLPSDIWKVFALHSGGRVGRAISWLRQVEKTLVLKSPQRIDLALLRKTLPATDASNQITGFAPTLDPKSISASQLHASYMQALLQAGFNHEDADRCARLNGNFWEQFDEAA